MTTGGRIVYLMRGLPACGKSYTAKRLARPNGVVVETDSYFYTEVGEDLTCYDYDHELLPAAREWNFERFREAVLLGRSPIVVDRGNGLNAESRAYAVFAVQHGYAVELAEPESPWWQELRVLLKYRRHLSDEVLDSWSHKLADASRRTHRVPAATIRSWMNSWRHDLTVQQILSTDP